MAGHNHETEIKLAVPNPAEARALLRNAQFRILKRRVFEANTVYDTPRLQLRKASQLIRIREAGRIVTLTYKGPPIAGRHKSREELEVRLGDAANLPAILGKLGYAPIFRYEKYRTEYRRPGESGIATLDETPIGVFLELEGAPAWIDRTARKLGFRETDYITASYGRLYMDWCKRCRVKPGNMVFSER
jgi:adenylate cyclase class 2